MHWIYLIHEFHNLSWITEINDFSTTIYWDAPVSYFVQSILWLSQCHCDMSICGCHFRKFVCKYATLVLLTAWKTKLYSNSEWRIGYIQQRKRAKCTSLKSCHSFKFIAISNSAIINESVNTAQLISYLHHLYTLFITIRGFASRASRTLVEQETLAFWAVSGFWLTKLLWLAIALLKSTDMSLICYNVQRCKNRAQTQIHIWFRPEAAAGYFRFVVYVYLVASFPSLELGYIHTFSLNHSGDPFFKSWSRPRVWKPLVYLIRRYTAVYPLGKVKDLRIGYPLKKARGYVTTSFCDRPFTIHS